MFVPAIRQTLAWAAVIAVVVALGVYLIRRTERRSPFSSKASTTLDVTTPLPQRNELTSATPVCDRVRPATTADLIEQLRAIDWFQFEKLVALVYEKRGYSVTRRGGANPDGGIDLVIEKDGQRSAVQCKQWKTWNVGVKAVREFLGALTDAGISKGIFITLRGYSGDAKQLAGKHGIEIVNETGLARLLESTDAQFDPEALAIIRDKRKYCPKCESAMVVRTTKKGFGAGRQFWGCSAFPRCRFKMPLS
jgi:restriction endonuclease Mrr